MRTWADLQNEVLGLIFVNNTGGKKTDVSDTEVAEYIINMPEAANCAFRELACVSPERKSFVITAESGKREFDLSRLCGDFMCFDSDGVYYTGEGTAEKAEDYFIHGTQIIFTGDRCGSYRVSYIAYPAEVTADTDGETVLPLGDAAADAAAYYIASRIYIEEEPSLAAYYMNVYENKKKLLEGMHPSAGMSGDRFISEKGWY